jgi:hypothetical protein
VTKGQQNTYPVRYTNWRKLGKGNSIAENISLDDVKSLTKRLNWDATPINPKDNTSPWVTGRPKAIERISQLIGESEYQARLGVHCWLVGVYWVEIIKELPNGQVLVSNLTENVKKDVENIQATIEGELIHPLIRGKDIDRWKAEAPACMLIPQDPKRPDKGYPEELFSVHFPKAYSYLCHFRELLINRSGYQKFLQPQGEPFYALYDIGPYSFATYKVVWMRISNSIKAAVNRGAIPDNGVTFVSFEDEMEAHYFCSAFNSSLFSFAVASFSIAGTGTWGSPHILRHIKIPTFDPKNNIHLELAALSKEAHIAALKGDQALVLKVEVCIDELARQLWGLTKEELIEIQESLEELQ